MSKPVPINLVPHAALLEDGREFLRMWAKTDGPMACFLNPAQLGADPFLFGMALADAVRHGARAWAAAVNVPVEHAEERIWEGLDAERAKPTDTPGDLAQPADADVITYTRPQDLN
ncbi:MAG: hypothetical protein JWN21_1674 [Sphingomonas bacterium]|uniref:DUF5076 domain-containing protein n=1 Tax=Sphingomonas bacterium TaxID=1895847 RepID=UPI00260A2CF2|nr:DUF5076 domain-containing protein [Sphingomonas bacterium]MDB5696131.1 hypothetical protein [Sphingomonas bacterium]